MLLLMDTLLYSLQHYDMILLALESTVLVEVSILFMAVSVFLHVITILFYSFYSCSYKVYLTNTLALPVCVCSVLLHLQTTLPLHLLVP